MLRVKMVAKKILCLALLTALVVCESAYAQQLKDGVYYAEEASFDSHGWKGMITIVVKNGKITQVFYDEINKNNELKNLNNSYSQTMKAASKITPKDAVEKLSASLIAKQDPAKVDAVTGATGSVEKFKATAQKALSEGPEKKSGKYYPGFYSAESNYDSHGYKAYGALLIKNGNITGAWFGEFDKAWVVKSTNETYSDIMKQVSGVTPAEAERALTQALVAKQDPAKVDAVTGATDTSKLFKELMTKALSYAQ
jgi:major membrane immunogen (membrane-anchored lipoprotein)